MSYRCLKSVLCIQELDDFGYIPLSISLRPSPFSPLSVCVLKILSILKKKKKNYISCTKAYGGGIGNGFWAIYFWD